MRRAIRGWRVLVALVAAFPLWLFPYIPFTDAPNHLLAAFIIVHYRDPRFSFPRYFTVDLTPRSNILGHYVMIALLRLGLSPETTLRVLATLIVWLTLGGMFALMAGMRGRAYARQWLPLGIVLAYTWFFHQGFLNFSLSVGLGLLTLALGVWRGLWGREGRPGWRDHVGVTLLAYLTYLAHALGLALVLTGVAGFLLGEGVGWVRERAWRRGLRRGGAMLLPFLLLGGIVVLTGRLSPNARGEAGAFLSPPFIVWVPLSKKVAELRYGLLNFSPFREQIILLPLVLLYLAGWVRTLSRPRGYHLPALVALAAYFVLPMGFWVPFFIYERFWLFALLLGALALPHVRRSRRVGTRVVVWGVTLLFLLNLTNDYRIANGYLADYHQVLGALPSGATAFPFTYHHQGRISPARHFWAYAMMERDVFIPMVFAETYHPVQYRPQVARPYPLHYEDGFFAEHAHNRAVLWVREDDPLMRRVTLPKLGRHGYVRVGRVGPYGIYALSAWPPPVPPEARPHIREDVRRAYSHLLLFGYPPPSLVQEVERGYHLEVRKGLARLYGRVP